MKSRVIVNFKAYLDATHQTAIYPTDDSRRYVYYGLLGEMGEMANKVKKTLRGDYRLVDIIDALRKEVGDICWYAARYSYEYGLDTSITEIHYEHSAAPDFYKAFDRHQGPSTQINRKLIQHNLRRETPHADQRKDLPR